MVIVDTDAVATLLDLMCNNRDVASFLQQSGSIAVIGQSAEEFHDEIDSAFESLGFDELVTSWHDYADLQDIVFYSFARAHPRPVQRFLLIADPHHSNARRLIAAFAAENTNLSKAMQ